MTDNDIIKALECCGCDNYQCDNCPYAYKTCTVYKDSLDLINRQKAEIEQWKEEANRYQNLWCIATDDIFKAKSEAIKEFAERLKHSFFDNGYESPDVDFDYLVDNLVKEMIGDDNA